MEPTKKASEMTDKELLATWTKGVAWLDAKMQVTGSDKAQDGTPYEKDMWLKALKRLEHIEDELIKRGLPYGHHSK